MSRFSFWRFAWRSTWSGLKRSWGTSAAGAAAISSAVVLPLALYLALQLLQPVVRGIVTDPQISIFLAPTATPDAVARAKTAIEARLQSERGTPDGGRLALDFVDKATAFRQFRTRLEIASKAQALRALTDNPLPDAFVVRAGGVSLQRLETLAADLRKIPEAEAVQIDTAWAQGLAQATRLTTHILGIVTLLFGALVVSAAFAVTQGQVLAHRAEIDLARLLGATTHAICAPFALRGAVLAAFGASIASGIACAAVWAVAQAPSAGGPEIRWIELVSTCTVTIGASAVLGALGGWCAARWIARSISSN